MSFLETLNVLLEVVVEAKNVSRESTEQRQQRDRIESLEVGTRRVRARKEGRDLHVRYEEVVEDNFGKELLVIEGVWEYGKGGHHWFKPVDLGFTKLTEKRMERMLKLLEKEGYTRSYTLWNKWSSDQYYNATLWGM